MTETTQPTKTPDLYYHGTVDGRKQEREHCNYVIREFFKTFNLGDAPTIGEIEKKPDWLLHFKWLTANTGGDLNQIKEMYEKACRSLGYVP